jgi:hypothetical protein
VNFRQSERMFDQMDWRSCAGVSKKTATAQIQFTTRKTGGFALAAGDSRPEVLNSRLTVACGE